jgi:tetratricopeptide (TPR) repeat protein
VTLRNTRAVVHRQFSLAALVAELRDADGRLDAFSSVDPAMDVRAVFSWSYQQLTSPAAALFRLLGLHCGPDTTAPAAASLIGVAIQRVRPLLAELASAHLITERMPGRFALHDLLRGYAAELCRAADPSTLRRSALLRLLDYYLHSAYAADRLLYPHRPEIVLTRPQPAVVPETFADHGQAMAWFSAERAVLVAAVDQAVGNGFDAHARQTAWTLVTFFDRQGHWHDQLVTQQRALEAARRLGDEYGQADIHRGLGLAYTRLGRYGDANAHVRQALDLFTRHGDHTGQALAHRDLAYVWWRQDRREDALHHVRKALELSRTAGHRAGPAYALYAVGCSHFLEGDHLRALGLYRRALALYRDTGDRVGEAAAWEGRGLAHHHLGNHRQAVMCYRRALSLRRAVGDRCLEADSLLRIGDTHAAACSHDAARKAWRDAYEILDELGHPDVERIRSKLETSHAIAG